MKYILASASPRRKALLSRMGLEFQCIPAEGEEIISGNHPEETVTGLALQKALEVADNRMSEKEEELIIGADTVVVFDETILGKPADEQDAYRMLSMLQGKTHEVYTGVAVIRQQGEKRSSFTFAEKTEVHMYPMTDNEIMDYIQTGEPMDKAGSYGIQGRCAVYIRGILGDYNNVVGLPIAALYHNLKKLGIDIYENS